MVGSSTSRGFGDLFGEAKGKLDDIQRDLASVLPSFPGMPVGKYGDIAIGVDIHPTLAPPTPSMPVPHIGAVFDIMGAVMSAISSALPEPEKKEVEIPEDGSAPPDPPVSMGDMACQLIKGMAPSVTVHDKWIANAGTSIQHLPGIIAHLGPTVSPMASSEMWMGSSTVLCDGSPFSTQSHPSLSCNIVGMPSVGRKMKPPKPKVSLMAPLAALTTITSVGNPVLAGGPPTIDLFQLMMSMGLKGLGKLWKKTKGKVKKLFKKTKNAKLGDVKSPKKCTRLGEPVDVVTGTVLQSHLDFELSGPIPIIWRREYYSNIEVDGPIGYNWHHSYNLGIYDMEDSYTLRLKDGREVALPKLAFGENYFHRIEQLKWSVDELGYLLEDSDGYLYRFGIARNREGYEMLSQIATKDGFSVTFRYDGRGDLLQIIDSRNNTIWVDSDLEGKIRRISVYQDKERVDLIRYAYDNNKNLTEVIDARGVSRHFEYEDHLLVKHIQQTGMCFYWEYEGKGDNSRSTRTWGDGGVLEYRFKYANGVTYATDSLGNTAEYYYDSRNLIYKIVDANGGITRQIYNANEELEVNIDPEGLSTKSVFNEQGHIIKYTNENGQITNYSYDKKDNLTRVSSPSGVSLLWEYDEFDRVIKRTTANGEELSYVYDDKLLTQIVDGNGKVFNFEYNKRYELIRLLYPNGLSREWEYDEKGRLTRSKDVKGNFAYFQYDKADNLIWMQEPDGNEHHFEYDGFFNLIGAKDKLHEVSFTYGAMGVLRSRTQNGRTLKFDYDKELQLRRIINEGGEQYRFELDGLGQVVKETGFDGIEREYIRDGAGRVVEVKRPDHRWTKYKYDGAGNVIKEEHHDQSWTGYKYNSEGLLVEAVNEEGNIKFTRDRLGRIVKEEHGGNSITRSYNEEGDCIHIGSSLGADIHQEYDDDGNLISLKSSEAWQADWQRDNTGLELYRQMTGGVNIRTQRDNLGRESRKTVGVGTKKHSQKQYNWGIGNRLQNIQNELKSTSVNFEYDVFDNLIRADYQDIKELETVYRTPDAIGNYYQTPNRSDRKYGKSGKLLEDPTYHYHYDAEGNLIFKEFKKHQGFNNQGKEALEKKLKIKFKGTATGWQYEWSANGMLQQVINPEHGKIRFGYDPLGRRVFKETKKKRTNWLWDGNIPLHEWESHSTESLINIVTWIFEGGFVPCAKVTQDKSYSIVTDYLGTPTQMFDNEGQNIWDMELDIYGKVRTFKGSSLHDCPFRYQGQYLDIETGLYYNRFRYYDSEVGNYISQDPIGLVGNNPTLYGYVKNTSLSFDAFGLAYEFEIGAYGDITGPKHVGDKLSGHELLQSSWLQENHKVTRSSEIGKLNPSIALTEPNMHANISALQSRHGMGGAKMRTQTALQNINRNTALTRRGIYEGLLARGWEKGNAKRYATELALKLREDAIDFAKVKVIYVLNLIIIKKDMKELFAACVPFNKDLKGWIGGNPPMSIENEIPEDYIFYATLVHPEKNNKMLSILMYDDPEILIRNNIYPNVKVKVIEHDFSEQGNAKEKSIKDVVLHSISDYVEESSEFQFIKVGGEPRFIQYNDYYYEQLLKDNYSFFLQIDEEGYPRDFLMANNPFMYGALYLYKHDQTGEVIVGFWQYS